jgi:asparagine synthase (glutamine-hydrolysing)
MCGIFGAITEEGLGQNNLSKISEVLSHRGPDDQGFVTLRLQNKTIDLLHRRLTIIDLTERAHQPMASEDQSCWLVYNGEVYNFREIREELVKKGCKFKSDSDTEVVLRSYQVWGMDCVQKFVGMFAFAILDKNKNKLYLFRDHVGKKPLYYYCHNGIFLFCSELKGFMLLDSFAKDIDINSLYLYLYFGYIPAPYSIFKNTFKLEPGHILEVDFNGNQKKIKWWDIESFYNQNKLCVSFNEAKEALKEKLLKAFKYRLVADVPVGIFLSGGIDSTLIATLLQKNIGHPLKTFTIGFRQKAYNEAYWAKKIAQFLGTQHYEFFCTPKDAFGIIKNIPDIYDEPFADSSGIPTYLVSELSRNSVKVCLSGDGGDELFGGYAIYKKMRFYSHFLNFPYFSRKLLSDVTSSFPIKILKIFKSNVTEDKIYKFSNLLLSKSFCEAYLSHISYWNPIQLDYLLKRQRFIFFDGLFSCNPNLSIIEKMMQWDFSYYLPDDLLTKVDRASMARGLEVRAPILDKEVCSFAAVIPLQYKFNKRILKSLLLDYLPKDLLNRPKKGFSVPIHEWFRNELSDLFKYYLSSSKLNKHGFFDTSYVISKRDRYLECGDVSIHKLWAILVFQMWHEKWMES